MKKLIKKLYLGIMLFFLYSPIAILIIYSFNNDKTRAHWGGFSLRWYFELFNNRFIIEALYNTFTIAFLSSLIATVIGTAAAFGINALKKLPKMIVMNITNLPVLNPDIVTGVSMMILFIFLQSFWGGFKPGYWTLLIAHITFNIPYVILSVLPKIRQLNANLYEAALDLGAPPFYAFTRVMLPGVMPGVLTGAILAFTLSLDDFIISFFTTGAGVNNLSIYIYTYAAKKGISPEINALSTLMFLAVMFLLLIINKRDRRETIKNKK